MRLICVVIELFSLISHILVDEKMVFTRKSPKIDWVQCDDCARWDIFDNASKELGIDKFDEDKIAKSRYTCRQCKFEVGVNGRLNSIEERVSKMEAGNLEEKMKQMENFKEVLGDVEEIRSGLKDIEKVKQSVKEFENLKTVPKEVDDLKKVVKEAGDFQKGLKVIEKDLETVKKGMKDAIETKKGTESKWKIVEELKKDVKEVKDRSKSVDVDCKSMEELVDGKVKSQVKDMKAEMSESQDMEQRRCNIIIHGVEEDKDVVDLDDLGSRGSWDLEKVHDILGRGLRLKASGHVLNVSRVGRPRTDTTGRPRLLKVELKSVEGRNEILKRAKGLKDMEEFGKTFIVPDLTRKQQEVDKALRENVRKFRLEGELHVMIRKGKVIKNEGGKQVVLYCPTPEKL